MSDTPEAREPGDPAGAAASPDPDRPHGAIPPPPAGDPAAEAPLSVRIPPPPPVIQLTRERPYVWGLGRRKTAVARVRIRPGAGAFLVNGRGVEEFFPTIQMRRRAQDPLLATETVGVYDVFCTVHGGGPVGQSDAVRMGLSRALKTLNPGFEPVLRDQRLLTRDSRMKERKKYGRRGARRGFQFSKR
jgi:small subunit ribosomal protein S9